MATFTSPERSNGITAVFSTDRGDMRATANGTATRLSVDLAAWQRCTAVRVTSRYAGTTSNAAQASGNVMWTVPPAFGSDARAVWTSHGQLRVSGSVNIYRQNVRYTASVNGGDPQRLAASGNGFDGVIQVDDGSGDSSADDGEADEEPQEGPRVVVTAVLAPDNAEQTSGSAPVTVIGDRPAALIAWLAPIQPPHLQGGFDV